MRIARAGLGLLLALCAGGAQARHHGHSRAGVPGEFDYYVLSLSWSPAFCLSSPASPECGRPRRYGLIVHGLWPQWERGSPEHCPAVRGVPEDVARDIADLMPAHALIDHEWSTHGSCSGLNPAQFFAQVRRAYSSLTVPARLAHPTQAAETAPEVIAAEFLRANPRLSPASLVVTCSGQGAPRLREIRLCLDRDLMPRACAADAMRGACKAPQIIIPPIH